MFSIFDLTIIIQTLLLSLLGHVLIIGGLVLKQEIPFSTHWLYLNLIPGCSSLPLLLAGLLPANFSSAFKGKPLFKFCDFKEHSSLKCNKVSSYNARIAVAKGKNLCALCLSAKHVEGECPRWSQVARWLLSEQTKARVKRGTHYQSCVTLRLNTHLSSSK